MTVIRWTALVALTALAGCGGDSATRGGAKATTAQPSATTVSAEDVAKHNRAVAHMNRNEIAEAESILQDLAERHPGVETFAVDRAIAAMHRIQGGAQAVPLFEDALRRFPDSDRARYGLAYLYSINGKIEEAVGLLKPMADKIEAKKCADPHVAYLYGRALADSAQGQREALAWFKKALELDPFFFSAAYGASRQARFTRGEPAETKRLDELAKRLDAHPFGTINGSKLRRMGPLLDVIPLENRLAMPAPPPTGEVFLEPVLLLTTGEWGAAKPSASASMTVCDTNGDGALDLLITGVNIARNGETIPNAVLLQGQGGKFKLATDHPLAKVADVTAALWGDVDNDGLTDVFLCRRGGNQLWRQSAAGKWGKPDDAKSDLGPKGACNGGVLFDADFDGDLDVFLVYDDGPNELLRNAGSGAFKAAAKVLGVAGSGKGSRRALAADLDGNRMPELVVFHKGAAAEIFKSDVKGGFVPASEMTTPAEATAAVAVAVPFDRPSKLIASKSRSPQVQLALADVTGDGTLALFESSDGTIAATSSDDERRPMPLPAIPRSAAWTLANLDAKRGPALVCLPADGGPPVAAHPGPGRHDFFSLTFIGDRDRKKMEFRSNRSGIGVKFCMRVADQWLCQFPLSQSSGPGQSLQPTAVGTRGARGADFLFIDWPNGDFQSEFSPPVGRTTAIKELDRIPVDSCPLLFAWDGKKYQFVTDFLGVGGIDYLVSPGEHYTPSDPVEHLLLPHGAATVVGDAIKLKVLEPAEEITFLDRVALVAYDLPPGWGLTLDERHSALPPKPTHEPRFFRPLTAPSRAFNEHGADCTRAVQTADLVAATTPPPDRLAGRFERPHQLTLEFPAPLDVGFERPILVMDGWVAFPDAQAVMNAAQAGVGFSAPRLEAAGTDGAWKVVYPEFGYPAGMQRQTSLPLQDLPKGCNKLRITHELEAYWDRIAVADARPCPEVRRHECKRAVAFLAAVGTPRFDRDRDGEPFWFDYGDRNRFWPPRAPSGKYTRFGDCRELVEAADDASATIGPGEEVHLEFKAPAPPPAGWTRRYVLEARGWCRGMRLYTRNSSTVEPRPATGLPQEPRDRLHRKYNTRSVGE